MQPAILLSQKELTGLTRLRDRLSAIVETLSNGHGPAKRRRRRVKAAAVPAKKGRRPKAPPDSSPVV